VIAPVAVESRAFWRDGSMLLAATLIGAGLMASGMIGRAAGTASLILLFAYISVTYWLERRHQTAAAAVYSAESEAVAVPTGGMLKAGAMVAGGLVLTIFAAKFLVSGAVTLATSLGISETIIGLTIVAVGTSMPELVTSIIAARKGQHEVAFGNIIGSNIFNILGILGTTALVHPLAVPEVILALDVWVMLAATGLLCVFAISGWRISRREGLLMMAGYAVYTGYLISHA
jgi:cation:H+ antiporter